MLYLIYRSILLTVMKSSILVGDYLFSNALSKMYDIDNRDALKVLSDTAKRLSEGEIMQVESAMKKNLTEEKYLKMIPSAWKIIDARIKIKLFKFKIPILFSRKLT